MLTRILEDADDGVPLLHGLWALGAAGHGVVQVRRGDFARRPVEVYGHGEMSRDFTYIDDLVEAVVRLIDKPPREGEPVGERDSLSPAAPYRVVNIGGGQPVGLMAFIAAIERALGGRSKSDAADAEGRRAGDMGRAGSAAGADGLCPGDRRRDGRAGVRAMVSRRFTADGAPRPSPRRASRTCADRRWRRR